ncbi:carbohydrate kinase family protein [Aureimonas sp. AU12]|uniref:carbohydrate kinase family protein n=1 Tax=Aureimonas sp. AU12 TaxID=1638161 RepID=UPI0007858BB4|nr:carbohydrate kinase family protein [Aureimonas sp. AU12]
MAETSRRGFLTGGTWCADHNKIVDRWPREDTVTKILGETVEGGGSACNFAIDIRRLDPGMPVATIGCIGDDADGAVLLAQADAAGIDRSGMVILPNERTNYTDAYTASATGRRTHLYLPGASAHLSPDHFDFSRSTARIFHLGLPGIHDIMDGPWKGEANGWVAVLKAARAAGLETNFEMLQIAPERLRGFVEPCLGHLDTLVINDYEVGALTGRTTTDDGATDLAACLEAGALVMERGAMKVLAIHFPTGGLAFERDGTVTRVPSVAVPPEVVKGANGAGDAFAAGFMHGWHEGRPVSDALRLAHATAAASLRSVGTTGSVEPVDACLALADRWGWREMPAA